MRPLTRDEWIAEVKRLLIDAGPVDPEVYVSVMQQWAESLAEQYYDEFPNDYSPKDAVNEEWSNA